MSNNLGNKETMARNIKYYMEKNNVNSLDMCRILGVPQSTFSYWLHAKTYPRIDKIERMANYFGISKADLVEEWDSPLRTKKEYSDLSSEEQALIRCWRQATDKERQNIAFILRDYGMPFPQAEPEIRQSRSSGT